MSDTGYKSPSSAVNYAKAGSDSSWSTPGNVVSSNDVYASSTLSTQTYSDWIRAYNFNCGIPTGATIVGIEVKIERKSSHYGVHRDDDVILAVGTSGKGDDKAVTDDDFYLINDSIATYGSSTDLWGTTWSAADINDLSVFLSVANDGCCDETCYIDHIQVKVWYTTAAVKHYPDYTMMFNKLVGRAETQAAEILTQWKWNPQSATNSGCFWGPVNGAYAPTTCDLFSTQPSVGDLGWVRCSGWEDVEQSVTYTISGDRETLYLNGVTYNVTDEGGQGAQHYAIYGVWDGMSYRIKTWATLYNGESFVYYFYHDQTYSIGNVYNPVWTGGGNQTRQCIKQQEAWWDSAGGWALGSGTTANNGGPWGGVVAPTGENVVYGRTISNALDTGMSWKYEQGGTTAYLHSTWSWGDDPVIPTVTTQAVGDIMNTTATGNGNITVTGGENCLRRGICWSTSSGPTRADNYVEDTGSFGTGVFTGNMTNLVPATHYYVRAYAYNSAGYGYTPVGSEVEFDTTGSGSSCIGGGSYPSLGTEYARAGSTGSWADPDHICADDANFAVWSVAANGYSPWLEAKNFGFNISDNATIDGIQIEIKRYADGAAELKDSSLKLAIPGAWKGDDKAYTAISWPTPAGVCIAYGASDDLWGTTWTPMDINNIEAYLSVERYAGAGIGYVNYITVRVWHTEGKEEHNAVFFGANF